MGQFGGAGDLSLPAGFFPPFGCRPLGALAEGLVGQESTPMDPPRPTRREQGQERKLHAKKDGLEAALEGGELPLQQAGEKRCCDNE